MRVVLHRDSWSKKISEGVYEGRKIASISQFKVEAVVSESDAGIQDFFCSGYVNTKNKPDAYGDIPYSLDGEKVYDLSRYKQNPVLLANHENETCCIAGESVKQVEDEVGLFMKFRLMRNPAEPAIIHTINAVKEGILKAFSIGGKWHFDDPKNKAHLTKAEIHEVSLVAIGADPRALASELSMKGLGEDEQIAKRAMEFIKHLVSEYRKTDDEKILGLIAAIKEQNYV